MRECVRCGKPFSYSEHELCMRCTCILENEKIGRIRSQMRQKAKLHVDGGMYVELKDVNEVLDNNRIGVI